MAVDKLPDILGGAGFQGNPFDAPLISSPIGDTTGIGKILAERAGPTTSGSGIDQYADIEEMLYKKQTQVKLNRITIKFTDSSRSR